MKSRQLKLADKAPAFAADPLVGRRARAIVEAIGDALIRRYGTWESAAAALDAVFGVDGRPVSGSVLRAAFSDSERNYPRLEWSVLVLDDPQVQAAIAPRSLSPDEELRLLREHMAGRAAGELERFDRAIGRAP